MLITDDFNTATVTIYNRFGETYKKSIINDCLWRKTTDASFKSQGTLSLDTAKLYISNVEFYVGNHDYKGVDWTITTGNDKNRTYIVEGVCEFNFTATSERDMAEQVRAFEKTVNYRTPKSIDNNIVGDRNLDHIMILC